MGGGGKGGGKGFGRRESMESEVKNAFHRSLCNLISHIKTIAN